MKNTYHSSINSKPMTKSYRTIKQNVNNVASIWKSFHETNCKNTASCNANDEDDPGSILAVEESCSSPQTGVAVLVPLHVGRDHFDDDHLNGDQQEQNHERRHVVFLLCRDHLLALQQQGRDDTRHDRQHCGTVFTFDPPNVRLIHLDLPFAGCRAQATQQPRHGWKNGH